MSSAEFIEAAFGDHGIRHQVQTGVKEAAPVMNAWQRPGARARPRGAQAAGSATMNRDPP